MIVAFCGHRTISDKIAVQNWLTSVLQSLLRQGIRNFYLGGYGEFDLLAAEILRSQREPFPDINSVLILPYPNKPYDHTLYTGAIYPPLENIPPRYAISHRNRWMADHSDLLVAYVLHEQGGAAATLKYAQRKSKGILSYREFTEP